MVSLHYLGNNGGGLYRNGFRLLFGLIFLELMSGGNDDGKILVR